MRVSVLFLLSASTLGSSVSAFAPVHPPLSGGAATSTSTKLHLMDPASLAETASSVATAIGTQSSTILTANGSPDWGLFEGRIGSLLHPLTMFGLLAFSVYTAVLGFQWRRQRTIGDDISVLKKTLPDLGEFKTVQEALDAAKKNESGGSIAQLQAALGTEAEIASLTKERKDLVSKSPRDKHFSQGALLAFVGTAFAIEGPLNTYARAGKLFPGPHLYAGAGLVVLWALAVSTVPAMIKGNDTARTIHIGANIGGIALFAWQVTTGVPILLKVIELTKWP